MTSRIGLLTIVSVLPLVFVGCGDDGPATESSGTETGDGDGDPGDGDGDPGDGDGDGDPGDGDGDGDPGDGDGDTGDGDCEPAGDAYSFFDIDAANPGEMIEWQLVCKSNGVKPADGESGYQISLVECVSGGIDPNPAPTQVVLTIDSSPATEPFIQVDTSVRLHWVQTPPFIAGKWFTLHSNLGNTQGTLLLAGIEGPSVVPGDSPNFDYAPLGVELVSIGCPTFEHDSQCGLAERQGFEVEWDGDTVVVPDHNSGYVGQLVSYQAIVGEALDFPEVTCDDFPPRILSALFFLIPEG